MLSLSLWLPSNRHTLTLTPLPSSLLLISIIHTNTHTHTHVPCTKFHSKLIDKKCFCLYIFCLSAFPISIPRKDSKFWSLIVRFLAFHTLSLSVSLLLSIYLSLLLSCSDALSPPLTSALDLPHPTKAACFIYTICFIFFVFDMNYFIDKLSKMLIIMLWLIGVI